MANGSLKSSYGAKAACEADGSDVERFSSKVPSGKANGEKRLRSGRASGVISPSLTADTSCNRSTKDRNRDRLILPAGSRRTRTRAGATGERGSPPMGTFGRVLIDRRDGSYCLASMWYDIELTSSRGP